MPNPLINPAAEDVIKIGSVTSPGLSILSGFKRPYGWEVKKGKGVKGSTTTLNEYPPCEGSVEIQLWLDEHFDAWDLFLPHLKYDPTKKTVSAVDWYHPSTVDIDLKSVVCKNISARVHKGNGLYSYTLDFLEYNPPPKKSAVSTPKGSKTSSSGNSTSGGSGDPVADAKQAEIARLLEEARKP